MAIKTTKTLELQFGTAAGKTKKISLRHAKEGVTADVAKAAMNTIVDKDIFVKDGVDVYAKSKGAQYVTRTVEDIFKAE